MIPDNFPVLTVLNVFILGRCKSTFQQFLYDTMEAVQDNARREGLQLKTVFLPHCTCRDANL